MMCLVKFPILTEMFFKQVPCQFQWGLAVDIKNRKINKLGPPCELGAVPTWNDAKEE